MTVDGEAGVWEIENVDSVLSEAEVIKLEVDSVDAFETVVGENVLGKVEVGDVRICVIEVCDADG